MTRKTAAERKAQQEADKAAAQERFMWECVRKAIFARPDDPRLAETLRKIASGETLDAETGFWVVQDALKIASEHLSYCGYGDKWERECAEAGAIDEQITLALAAVIETRES